MKDPDTKTEILRLPIRVEMHQRVVAPDEHQSRSILRHRHQFRRRYPVRDGAPPYLIVRGVRRCCGEDSRRRKK